MGNNNKPSAPQTVAGKPANNGQALRKTPIYELTGAGKFKKTKQSLPKGTNFKALSVSGKYARIEAGGSQYYVLITDLSFFLGEPLPGTFKARAWIFSEANSKSKYRLERLPKGTQRDILGFVGKFAILDYNGNQAFVETKNVTY